MRLDDPDRTALWFGSAFVSRSDGGLPTGPAAAVVSALAAGQFARDGETDQSMLDDALRVLFRSLPDFRSLKSPSDWG